MNFECSTFAEHWNQGTQLEPVNPYLTDFITILAICHTIIIDEKNGKMVYNASSPDELALTNAARHFGIVFEERDEDNNIVIHNTFTGVRLKY